jgi:hypothetical protein
LKIEFGLKKVMDFAIGVLLLLENKKIEDFLETN